MLVDNALREREATGRPIRVGMIGAGATGRAIALQLGTPVPVERLTREADVEDLVAHGLSNDFAHLMNDTGDTFSRYGLLRAEPPQAAVTGTTPIDDFIRGQFAPALTARAGAAPTR